MSQRELLTDEFSAALVPEIVQRPNAVIKNGGPQLLRGLMVPLCPSSNRYWRIVLMVVKGTKFPMTIYSMKDLYKRIRMMNVQAEESKAYLETLKELALQRGFRFFTDKPLRMDVLVCPRDRRKIDSHNYTKVLLDVFQEIGVYQDDAQIEDLRVRKGPVMEGGRLVISLWEITPNHQELLTEAWR